MTPVSPVPLVWNYAAAIFIALFIAIVLAAVLIAATLLLWRLAGALLGTRALATLTETTQSKRNFVVVTTLTLLILTGLLLIAFVPQLAATRAWIPVDVFAIGVMLSAGLFGFIFGLPRLNPTIVSTQTQPGTGSAAALATGPILTPNTNLEQVSDRFATLLTGVAFAQVITVPTYLHAFGTYFKGEVPSDLTGASLLGAALILYFGPLGFIVAYVVTRTIGAQAFARSDLQLFQQYGLSLESLPPLPDVPDDPSPEQRNAAATIAKCSLASLTTYSQKAAWARAQTILDHVKEAELGYQAAYVMDDSDPQLLVDYATVLYNDFDWDDMSYVLWLAKRAQSLIGSEDHDLRSRILSLIAAANLYKYDGYIESIETINALLQDTNLAPHKTSRFYRACGFGQLYWAYSLAGKLSDAEKAAISDIINHDVIVTLAFGSEMRDQLLMVTDPAQRPKSQVQDNDLQYFAHDDVVLQKQLGLIVPPPQPTENPPSFVALPSGYDSVAPYAAHCPK